MQTKRRFPEGIHFQGIKAEGDAEGMKITDPGRAVLRRFGETPRDACEALLAAMDEAPGIMDGVAEFHVELMFDLPATDAN